MASEPALELAGVSRDFGGTTAVEDLSLTVDDGEFFTLVGPSGCGKTTTLRLIAGLESPSAGTVRFDGRDVAGVPPEDRNVGIVFQNYALFPHMTVAENVAYGLNFADVPGGVSRAERVEELLELVDLAGFGEREPDALSGGQQQRVALARALAPGPDVFLLDEPMSALDAGLREELRRQLRAIQRDLGITTVYVTHDQEEALAISDRVAVMRSGTAEQVGRPQAVYRRPASRFVAEFVGDNNIFEGRVTGVENGTATVTLGDAELVVNATPVEGPALSVGERVTVSVRPEEVVVDGEDNALPATVESSEFLGESTRVRLEWAGGSLLVRTRESLTGTVTIGFPPEAAHVIERGD